MMRVTTELEFVRRARSSRERITVLSGGRSYTHAELLHASESAASRLLAGSDDLCEARVVFLVPPSFAYAAIQWGIWRAGGVAVPLPPSQPPAECEHVVADSRATIIVGDRAAEPVLLPLANRHGCRYEPADALLDGPAYPLPALDPDRRAMILYTSGTTSRPKGVVTTHGSIEAQVRTLVDAWGWTCDDRILLVLPLHHVHGIINVLACALWAGATCDMLPKFDADETWRRIAGGDLTLFMAVPTIYSRLIAAWDAARAEDRAAMAAGCRRVRLMVSGSAALPVGVLERWRAISGHDLLERYGMTEIGMALSNPLRGKRRPGFVGTPLAGVEVRLVDDEGRVVRTGTPGEIEVRGAGVFLEYWGLPDQTRNSFHDGWFRTGDVAVVEDGSYRILGRRSVDIIKTGGHKVSALEIEEVLRTHPDIVECAVVGIADPEWGERVAAAVLGRPGSAVALESIRAWARPLLATHKIPTRLLVVDGLPRNAMGKVVKAEVRALFADGVVEQ
jgi:malonyl-CoA/methylmalonyl-CoA synthetase